MGDFPYQRREHALWRRHRREPRADRSRKGWRLLRATARRQIDGLLLAGNRPMDVIIYHNADCGTSRNTLAMIRNAGVEPHVVEYLQTPPSRALLRQLVARMGVSARDLLR